MQPSEQNIQVTNIDRNTGNPKIITATAPLTCKCLADLSTFTTARELRDEVIPDETLDSLMACEVTDDRLGLVCLLEVKLLRAPHQLSY